MRYRLDSEPCDTRYCHCRLCQKSTGAPVMAFTTVQLSDFVVTQGEIAKRRWTHFGERGFCRDCDTPLTIHVVFRAETIDITVVTLDDPDDVAPAVHIWRSSRVDWFETADDWPRHEGFRRETRRL